MANRRYQMGKRSETVCGMMGAHQRSVRVTARGQADPWKNFLHVVCVTKNKQLCKVERGEHPENNKRGVSWS